MYLTEKPLVVKILSSERGSLKARGKKTEERSVQ
jgi:hypothetical protein